MVRLPELTAEERAVYEWQMWVPGVGEPGQQRLKLCSALVTRVGGLGGQVAYQLAAAGIGRLVIAHAGVVKPADLNRQLLMTHDAIGTPRVECAARRLKELNPRLDIVAVAENVNAENCARLVKAVDVVVDCAPTFEERLLLNKYAVKHRQWLVECAMYEMTAQVTTINPGQTACLACRTPEPPPNWKRQFPVFGAVSGLAGCIGAVEVIKLLCMIGEPLYDRLLTIDLREMRFQTIATRRNPKCPVCSTSTVDPARSS